MSNCVFSKPSKAGAEMYVTAVLFTRLNETPTAKREHRELSTTVKITDPLEVGGALLACMWVFVCMSGKEVVNLPRLFLLVALEKLAVDL